MRASWMVEWSVSLKREGNEPPMAKNYWMFVQTPENFAISKSLAFAVHGLGTKYRRRAERMQPGDKVLYYVSGMRKWAVVGSIASRCYEDTAPIWRATSPGEDFRYRIKIAPAIVLEEAEYIDALVLAPRLEYVKRWTPDRWPLAFFDYLHLLPQRDYRLVEGEIERVVSGRRRPLWTGPPPSAYHRSPVGAGAGQPATPHEPPLDKAALDAEASAPASGQRAQGPQSPAEAGPSLPVAPQGPTAEARDTGHQGSEARAAPDEDPSADQGAPRRDA